MILPKNIQCGYWDGSEFGNLTVSPKRRVSKYEIEFYLEDGKTTTIDNRTYEIKKNHIQIAKPGQIRHSLLPFQTAFLKFEAEGYIAEKLSKANDYFCSSHPQKMYETFDEIILLSEGDNRILLQSKILYLINLVLADSEIPNARGGKNYKIISMAKRFIEENFSSPIKLSDIAEAVHLSPIHFHNIFTEGAGISPHKYLINCRIENAKKLLWDTEIPISDVAEKSGFGCQQYLNKIFKSETGLTPATYRKNFQDNYEL